MPTQCDEDAVVTGRKDWTVLARRSTHSIPASNPHHKQRNHTHKHWLKSPLLEWLTSTWRTMTAMRGQDLFSPKADSFWSQRGHASDQEACTSQIPRSIAPLWRHQSSLPRLPVPDLYLTCLRYLRTLKPILSDEEFASARAAVVDFALGSDGRRLQSRLLARAKANSDSSWLIDWWNDVAYLTDTGPVVFYVSYFYAFKDLVPALRPQPGSGKCVTLGARIK